MTKIETVSTAVTFASRPAKDVSPVGRRSAVAAPADRRRRRRAASACPSQRRRRGRVRCATIVPMYAQFACTVPAGAPAAPALLLDRVRLAAQRRLVDRELGTLEQPQVGRDDVADLEQADVAAHELRGRKLERRAVAQRGRPAARALAQARRASARCGTR